MSCPSTFWSMLLRRFHFRSRIVHISPSDGIQNCHQESKVKECFRKDLKIAVSYHASDHIFATARNGMSRVYRSFWDTHIFYGDVDIESSLKQNRPGFGFSMVENTPIYLDYFFVSMGMTPSKFVVRDGTHWEGIRVWTVMLYFLHTLGWRVFWVQRRIEKCPFLCSKWRGIREILYRRVKVERHHGGVYERVVI